MSREVFVLNGPNLNMLGKREPHLYGSTTLAQVDEMCRKAADELALNLFFAQSNAESEIIDWLHQARERKAAVVINPAGLSFGSIPVLDALKIVEQPIIEVHITNIHQREPLYQNSIMSRAATGVVCGLGTFGYVVALQAIAQELGAADG